MIIRNKFNGYVDGNNRLYPGGSPGPTQNTSYQTNIPEYAEPYVKTMLGATEKQVYKYDPSGKIAGFQPFQSYSDYDRARGGTGESVAGFTPMQTGAMRGIANYQLPGQTGAASQLAGYAGMGSMGAGQRYTQQATNPYAVQAYMSPYMEAALAPQLREAARQSAIMGQQNQAQAVQQGAFGGARSAIVEAERQRNLAQQQGDIYGRGMQNAFEQARQAQQFGANLELQGYGQGLQAAGQLGELGQQQYGQELGLMGKQMEVGGLQQQYEQQRLNQIIQDYATSQQYPLMQLGVLSNMLRGLPMQAATTQMYQAQPSMASQLAGGLGTGMALYGQAKQAGFNVAEGGHITEGGIKRYAKGGVTGEYAVSDIVSKLSDAQLNAQLQNPNAPPEVKEAAAKEAQRRAELRGMAGGGIVAFADRGLVTDEEAEAEAKRLGYSSAAEREGFEKLRGKGRSTVTAPVPMDDDTEIIRPDSADAETKEQQPAAAESATGPSGVPHKTGPLGIKTAVPAELLEAQDNDSAVESFTQRRGIKADKPVAKPAEQTPAEQTPAERVPAEQTAAPAQTNAAPTQTKDKTNEDIRDAILKQLVSNAVQGNDRGITATEVYADPDMQGRIAAAQEIINEGIRKAPLLNPSSAPEQGESRGITTEEASALAPTQELMVVPTEPAVKDTAADTKAETNQGILSEVQEQPAEVAAVAPADVPAEVPAEAPAEVAAAAPAEAQAEVPEEAPVKAGITAAEAPMVSEANLGTSGLETLPSGVKGILTGTSREDTATPAAQPTALTSEEQALADYAKTKKDVMGRTAAEQAALNAEERAKQGIVSPYAAETTKLEERKRKIEAGAKDEYMDRLSEFLMTWGSLPGPTLVAAANAGRMFIANSISDKKERKRLLDSLDSSISDINKAQYLEKLGDHKDAQAQIEAAGKTFFEVNEKLLVNKQKKAELQSAMDRTLATLASEEARARAKNLLEERLKNMEVNKATDFMNQVSIRAKALIAKGAPADENTLNKAMTEVIEETKGMDAKMMQAMASQSQASAALTAALASQKRADTDVVEAETRRAEATAKIRKEYRRDYRNEINSDENDKRLSNARKEDKAAGRNIASPDSAERKILQDIENKLLRNPAYKLLNPAEVSDLPDVKVPKKEEKTAAKPAKTLDKSASEPAGKKPTPDMVKGLPKGATIGDYEKGAGWKVLDKDGKLIGHTGK